MFGDVKTIMFGILKQRRLLILDIANCFTVNRPDDMKRKKLTLIKLYDHITSDVTCIHPIAFFAKIY